MRVQIGPEFFAKTKSEYSDWTFALPRELMQNSIDAGASFVEVRVSAENGMTVVTCHDTGCGMTRNIIEEKFLTLGGSYKLDNAVGGFGAAKSLIAFSNEQYDIYTNDLHVNGRGSEYTITEHERTPGAKFVIKINGDYVARIVRGFKKFIAMSRWSGELILNEETITERTQNGFHRRSMGWCDVYTNNSHQSQMLIRINGMLMFTKTIHVDKCVVIELVGSSIDNLTTSRDGLKHEFQSQLDEFVYELSVDKQSALRERCGYVQDFDGPMITPIQNESGDVWVEKDETPITAKEISEKVVKDITRSYNFKFKIDNEIGVRLLDCWTPDDMSSYCQKLVKAWVHCLIVLHQLHNKSSSFSVGFIFSSTTLATCNSDAKEFLINPADPTVLNEGIVKRSKKWGFAGDKRFALIVAAAHEFTHNLGCQYHDEYFTTKYDDVMEKVMSNIKLFYAAFR